MKRVHSTTGPAPATRVLGRSFQIVVLVAGVTGLGLLALPGSTERFFSWGLDPVPVAALVGGLYLGSAAAFGWSAGRVSVAGRALCLLSLVFTVPSLVITLVHLSVFDLGRVQAWLWLLLFVAAPPFFLAMLATGAWRAVGTGPPLPPWARSAAGAVGVAALTAAVALLADPAGSDAWLPFAPPPLGGRFLGVWAAVVAFGAGWSALRNAEEARVTGLTAAALLGGAALGAARAYGALETGGRAALVAALVVASAVLAAAALSARTRTPAGTVAAR